MSKYFASGAYLAIIFLSFTAQAQIKADHPRNCIFDVGPTQMMFSAFQEGKTDEIFCQHIGDLGQTMIILDARQSEMDDMNLEARILQNVNQKDWRDDLEKYTIAIMPADKYLKKKNTVSFNHNFSREGNYILIIRASSDDGIKEYIGQYGFSVGETREWRAVAGALVIAVLSVAFFMWRDLKSKALKKNIASPPKLITQEPVVEESVLDDETEDKDAKE